MLRIFSLRSRWSVIPFLVIPVFLIGLFSSSLLSSVLMLSILAIIPGLHQNFTTRALRMHLNARGYEWVTYKDAEILIASDREAAWGLPPRDELAAIPDYRDTTDALDRILRRSVGLPEDDYHMMLYPVIEWMHKNGSLPKPKVYISYAFLTVMVILNLFALYFVYRIDSPGYYFFMVLPAQFAASILIPMPFIPSHLKRIGYIHFTPRQYRYVARELGRRAWCAPRHEDLQRILGKNTPIDLDTLCRAIMTDVRARKEGLPELPGPNSF